MFLGKHRCAFRENKLLTLPKQFREMLSSGGFITQGFDRYIWVLTKEAFNNLYSQTRALNIADPATRLLLRMILGSALELKVDDSGFIHIPDNLINFAGIEADAILVGQGDYFEIWAPAFWNRQEVRLQDAETNGDRFISLELFGRITNT